MQVALARVLVQKNKSEEAHALLIEALTAAPSLAVGETVRLALAMTEETLGNSDNALRLYEEILSTNPDSIVAANNLAVLVADHHGDTPERLTRALAHVKRFSTANNAFQLDTLAWIYYRLGQFKNAHDLLQRANAASHPNAAVRLGRIDDGRRLIEKAAQEGGFSRAGRSQAAACRNTVND
ncbi:MAG: Tfp pilus assembly protein PilF [Rhodospirillaceae bacterium]|nr:MAG: Tfp pilus assembly protein PilF [Rhodospirillaceae bacterium]